MTHMHIAGSIHADAAQGGPTWLELPDDLNALDLRLWPQGTYRDDDGGWRHATSPDGDTWEGAAETAVAAADAVATGGGVRIYAAEPPTGPRGLMAGLLGAF
mgnify:CR=1 FL=1